MTDTERALFEIHIRGTIEDVWREVTKTDVPQEAFFNMYMDTPAGVLAVGKPMRMLTRNRKYTGAVGEILEFDPPNRFAHTFRFTHLHDPECTVIYGMTESNGVVDFRMILTRAAYLFFFFRFFRAVEFTSPASTRTEHWPLGQSRQEQHGP